MKLQRLLIPFLFIFSYHAQAAINPGNDINQGGELILSVWDDATQASYTLDLGVTTRNFEENGTLSYDLSYDENWIQFVSNAQDLRWDIVGSDRDRAPWPGESVNGVMTTARIGDDASVTTIRYSLYNTLQSSVEQYANLLNRQERDYDIHKSYLNKDAGDTSVWGSFNNNVDFASAGYGESMEFWHLTTLGQIDNQTGRPYHTAVHTKMASTWILDNNQLVYATAIPVPAAVWLFGSALAGLVGVSRRKRS